MAQEPFTLTWDGQAEHCDAPYLVQSALDDVDLRDDGDEGDEETEATAEILADLEGAIAECPEDSVRAALKHLNQVANSSDLAFDRLTRAIDELEKHGPDVCDCAEEAWQEWRNELNAHLRDFNVPSWAVLHVTDRVPLSLTGGPDYWEVLQAFEHRNAEEAPTHLRVAWDGTVLRTEYRHNDLTSLTDRVEWNPLTQAQHTIAIECESNLAYAASQDPRDTPEFRALRIEEPVAVVAAALISQHWGAPAEAKPWRDVNQLVYDVRRLRASLDEQAWTIATQVARNGCDGGVEQLGAAVRALLAAPALTA